MPTCSEQHRAARALCAHHPSVCSRKSARRWPKARATAVSSIDGRCGVEAAVTGDGTVAVAMAAKSASQSRSARRIAGAAGAGQAVVHRLRRDAELRARCRRASGCRARGRAPIASACCAASSGRERSSRRSTTTRWSAGDALAVDGEPAGARPCGRGARPEASKAGPRASARLAGAEAVDAGRCRWRRGWRARRRRRGDGRRRRARRGAPRPGSATMHLPAVAAEAGEAGVARPASRRRSPPPPRRAPPSPRSSAPGAASVEPTRSPVRTAASSGTAVGGHCKPEA